jgi:hypothetical protein
MHTPTLITLPSAHPVQNLSAANGFWQRGERLTAYPVRGCMLCRSHSARHHPSHHTHKALRGILHAQDAPTAGSYPTRACGRCAGEPHEGLVP